MASKVTYLGFRINKNGVNPSPEKVSDLLNVETPENTTHLKSFLIMLNYYHKHLPNLAHILELLHQLLCKNGKWNWGREQKQNFTCSSRTLSSSEKNYSQIETESLAIIFETQKFH